VSENRFSPPSYVSGSEAMTSETSFFFTPVIFLIRWHVLLRHCLHLLQNRLVVVPFFSFFFFFSMDAFLSPHFISTLGPKVALSPPNLVCLIELSRLKLFLVLLWQTRRPFLSLTVQLLFASPFFLSDSSRKYLSAHNFASRSTLIPRVVRIAANRLSFFLPVGRQRH